MLFQLIRRSFSLYARLLAQEADQQHLQTVNNHKKRVFERLNLAETRQRRNMLGVFGPNHYARFSCRQFKIYRGSRGKWGNRGIVNDYKWRFPKAK